MEDEHIESLIGNEREWRKYLVKKLDTMQKEHAIFRDQITALRVWNRVWRVIGAATLGLLVFWIKGKI